MGKPAVNLTPAEVAERWNYAVTVGTLANWRAQKRGPVYVKLGTKVRYPLAKLEAWEAKHMRGDNDNHTERE